MEIGISRRKMKYWDDSQDAMKGVEEEPASRFVRDVTNIGLSHTITSGVGSCVDDCHFRCLRICERSGWLGLAVHLVSGTDPAFWYALA